ncbi:MAG: hypothetical protein ROZ64_06845 [Burkholderiaceae bacterium]|jgi:hypothetical protein|nr:hypothetical protein [Burkholderiaceae bacterium]
MAVHNLHTQIEIEASAERVWAVLTDFSGAEGAGRKRAAAG